MSSLLERTISGLDRRLILLAPPGATVPSAFLRAFDHSSERERLVHEVQRFRGRVYLADGAVHPDQLLPDGRHAVPEDEHSWHLVLLGDDGRPNACLWYRHLENASGLEQLRVRRCALARHAYWQDGLRRAVEGEIARAQSERLQYAEIGGWAVSEQNRRTADGITLALAVFALSRLLGGALGITTATLRHASAVILRRLGGSPLYCDGKEIPSYFDPHYGCEMELLRFDSRHPGSRYASAVDFLAAQLPSTAVLGSALTIPAAAAA